MIDRVAPTRRPTGRPVQRQRWERLLFLHWEVPVEVLRPMIPADLEIDVYEGKAFVGLVPFTMRGVRPVWAPPVPGISNFHETNVRTYVHRGGVDPGVWFFSLDAAQRLAVWIARTFWSLPYHHARMSLDERRTGDVVDIEYRSSRSGAPYADLDVRYTASGPVTPASVGSLEHFLAERYVLYASPPGDGPLWLGRVHHPPYPLQTARVETLTETLLASHGIARPAAAPLAHYADGVSVDVFGLERVAQRR